MKILIVEDIADDRRLLRYNLEHHGCEVVEAADGQEGLEMAKAHKPGLIVSDALMPKMDGFQFLRAVKTDDSLKEIPFIFYSATYTGYKEAELAISLGAEAFVIKPKEPEELWEELIGILEECKLRRPNGLAAELMEEEEEFLRKYSEIIATKLEEKVGELEKAKASVEEKEQEWQATFDSIGDCVTIHDRDFNVILANKTCEKVLGASQNDIRSRKCFELFHGRNEPHDACPKLNTERTGNPFETEMFEPKLNLWLSISCFPLLDKNGALRGVVHFARDITQRKRMEEAFAENEARFRATFEQAAVGIAHVAPDGRWLRVNQKLCDIVGYSREELLTKTFQDITYPDDLETDLNYVRKVLADVIKTYSMEKRYISKDGTLVWIKLTVSLVRDDLGQPKYFISVIEDITEHHKIEEQLRHAQRLEGIGQLAGGIAHDFNNVLNAVVGYAGLLQMQMDKSDPLKHFVDEIAAAGLRGAALTHQILAFSRKQVLDMRPANLNEIIKVLDKMLHRLIREDIRLEMKFIDKDLVVLADASQLGQVLINLVTNARDAIAQVGTIRISTDLFVMDEEFIAMNGYGKTGEYALLSVSDTGCGMDAETREHIFEPFFTTKEVGRGTGLGLAVVHGIVRQHNGYISIYSEVGQGSSFKIYLPLTEHAAEKNEAGSSAPSSGGTETILIAEDDAALRKLSIAVLSNSGYRVLEAVDGEDAIRKFVDNCDVIKLVILDGIMPKKRGKEAYEEIILIKPEVRVIFLSGYSEDILGAQSLKDKGLQYLSKPVTPSALLRTVREVLDK